MPAPLWNLPRPCVCSGPCRTPRRRAGLVADGGHRGWGKRPPACVPPSAASVRTPPPRARLGLGEAGRSAGAEARRGRAAQLGRGEAAVGAACGRGCVDKGLFYGDLERTHPCPGSSALAAGTEWHDTLFRGPGRAVGGQLVLNRGTNSLTPVTQGRGTGCRQGTRGAGGHAHCLWTISGCW